MTCLIGCLENTSSPVGSPALLSLRLFYFRYPLRKSIMEMRSNDYCGN